MKYKTFKEIIFSPETNKPKNVIEKRNSKMFSFQNWKKNTDESIKLIMLSQDRIKFLQGFWLLLILHWYLRRCNSLLVFYTSESLLACFQNKLITPAINCLKDLSKLANINTQFHKYYCPSLCKSCPGFIAKNCFSLLKKDPPLLGLELRTS